MQRHFHDYFKTSKDNFLTTHKLPKHPFENTKILTKLPQNEIEQEQWYQKESEKILIQARTDEVTSNERIRIYHHVLHKTSIKRSSILKLDTEHGLLEGHAQCPVFCLGPVN